MRGMGSPLRIRASIALAGPPNVAPLMFEVTRTNLDVLSGKLAQLRRFL